MNEFSSLEYTNDKLRFIDQTKLPLSENYIETDDYERIAEAIEKLEIRGAPAIGIAAAFAIAFSQKGVSGKDEKHFIKVFERLNRTRPTAVNLFWALSEMKYVFENASQNIFEKLIERAAEIHKDDQLRCDKIAENGIKLFTKKINVLTHCNTGSLATGGNGTALNVIKKAFEAGLINHVHVDETRPLLQGSRLTAFELEKCGIPFSIITDSMSAFFMKTSEIGLIIVGADRIASNGDSANKIGTYGLAIIAAFHNVPFYIAAPESTIDRNLKSGEQITIEFRSQNEIKKIGSTEITKSNYNAINPSFDVTPSKLIAGIITENKIYQYPYNF